MVPTSKLRKTTWAGVAAAAFLAALALSASPQGRAPKQASRLSWSESTFEDFADGRLEDGGANTYVSAQGSIQLVNRWDLNQDGFLDLVFSNTHPHKEKLDAAIYWGNGKDFDGSRLSYIPNDGAQHAAAADLDRDGRLDAVFANYTNGTWDGMDSYVYYGGTDEVQRREPGKWGFPPFSRKTTLTTRAAQHCALADLNRDGYPDIVFALSAGFWEYRASGPQGYESPSRIYWGSAQGFEKQRHTDLPALGASAVAVADLDGDSWPEIVFANREREGNPDVSSYIYWGGAQGFTPQRRTELPTHQANWVAIGDVNGDSRPDVIFANGKGPSSYAYLNGPSGFAPERRLLFPTSDARSCAIGDLNKDGHADVFFTSHQASGNPLTLSYLYWGSVQGYSADRRQEFETVGAWGVSLADLNHDGFDEIVVSSYKEHFSYDVPSVIYWSARGSFSATRRTALFTHGAVGNVVADFNHDGHPDILFLNTASRSRGGNSPIYVYWGDASGQYTPRRRISLPAVDPYEWAAGDLNNDGWADLVVANFGETVRQRQESFVYWGGSKGFSEERRSALMGTGSAGVSIADLDRDGHIDVVLANAPLAADQEKGAFIYWGGPSGFVTAERSELPTGNSAGPPAIADLNHDGNLDLVFGAAPGSGVPIFWGQGGRSYSASHRTIVPQSEGAAGVEVADLNRDGRLDLILSRALVKGARRTTSFIYWGDVKGDYSGARRHEFETEGTIVVTAADVDRDGWLDLVCPNYNTGSSRATLSRVFLGGPGGVEAKRMFTLPSNSGAGSMVADFNHDGYPDILLICHRSEGDPNQIGVFGDHVTDSYLYWGGPAGFRPENRLGIPARGPHNDSGVDLGNIYDRRLEWGYVSSAFNYGSRKPESISWKAQTPNQSSVALEIRTAATKEELERAAWSGPSGPGTQYGNPGNIAPPPASHAWIQYRALLRSSDGAGSPVLEEVTVVFR